MRLFYQNENITFCRYIKNLVFPLHMHSNIEIYYIYEGSIKMHIDRCSWTFYAGDIAVVFPNKVHGYELSENARGILFISPVSTSSLVTGIIKDKKPAEPVLRAGDFPLILVENLKELAGVSNPLLYETLSQLVLARLLLSVEMVPDNDYGHGDLLGQAISYIAANYRRQLSMSDLASKLGVSQGHLSRVLSKGLGMSFCTYLNLLRIDCAKNLLRSCDRSILEIALDCGYESLRTFNRVFLGQEGVSPREYRRI